MAVFVWGLAALVLVGTGISPGAGGEGPPLRYSLSAPATIAAGEPVELRFTLANVSREPLWVLTWYTPLEGLLGDVLRVERDGRPLEYRGPMVKRGDPEGEDYARIGPGESVSAVVNLGLGYEVDTPGAYTVDFGGRLFDVAADASDVPRPRNDELPMTIPGSGCSFRVTSR